MNVINIGLAPNDGTGDLIREAFNKTNANFVELLAAVSGMSGVTVTLNFDEMVALQANMPDIVSNYADLPAAVAAIGATPKTLLINTTTTCTASTTIPSTLSIIVMQPGLIAISTGQTLTINGPFNAGVYQVFNCVGTSTVVFGNPVKIPPEWFGYTPAATIKNISDMLCAGTSVIFDCYGDSTCFGADPANLPNAVARPAPEQFGIFLNFFYGNTAATVNNHGINSTNIFQLLAGTDGSGQTFDARIKATSATVIYCNHAMNTATNLTVTPDQFRAALMEVVSICSKYGKTLVLETPNPAGGYSITSTLLWVERVRLLASVTREVAASTNTPLVDNFYWCEKVIATGKYTMLQLLGDGIHPTQMLYLMKGQNMALPIITGGLVQSFTAENQYISCTDTQVLATTGSANNTVNGKLGKALATPPGTGSIRIAYVVDEPGLDIYMGHLTWSDGTTALSIKDDENILISNTYSMSAAVVSNFITDQEVCVIENATPGLRMLDLSCTSGSIGFNFLRTRKTGVEKNIVSVSGTPSSHYRKTILENFEFTSTSEATMILDDFPISTLLRVQEYELSATLGKSTGLVLLGLHETDTSSLSQALPGLVVGLDSSGYLCVWEHDLTTMNKTVIMSGTDLSLVSRRWYIRVTGTTIDVVDYALGAATPYTKTKAYYGGLVGFWQLNSGTLTIDKLVKIVRFL